MKCSKCNAEIPDSSKFCPQCAEPQSTPMIAAPPLAVESGSGLRATKMFLIGLAVAGIVFLVWNAVPGFRYAAPHHPLSPVDVWAVPSNPRMSFLPCEDDVHPNANWRARVDGLCHAEDAQGAVQRTFADAPQPPLPQPHSVPIGAGALTVGASAYSWYQVFVPPGVTSVSITGHFTATGGTGNDIMVYVLDEDGFTNFKNGHPSNTFYNSGKVTTASIGAVLPNAPTSYYLVLDNRFSFLTPKAVQMSVTLNYMQ
jgi:hypothetical protein